MINNSFNYKEGYQLFASGSPYSRFSFMKFAFVGKALSSYRFLHAPVMLACMSACLIACGDSGRQTTEEPVKQARKEPVELVFFSTSGWSEEAFNERFGNAIRSKFPEYTIRYIQSSKEVTLESLVTSKTPIDVYWDTHTATFSNLDRFKIQSDMSELIRKHNVNLNTLDPAAVQMVKTMSNGGMYALPLVNNTEVLYYNKDIFDKFGVPYPKDGMMRDDMLDIAKRMNRTDSGVEYYGLGTYPSYSLALSPFSIPYVDAKTEKATIQSDPRWKTVYEQLITAYRTTNNKKMSDPNQFLKGNMAMFMGLANMFLNFDVSTINWDIVSYPLYKELPGVGQQSLPTLFSITSLGKHPDEAMNALAYMLSEEAQKSLSERAIIPVLQTPSVTQAFGTKAPYKNKNYAAILKNKFSASPPLTVYDTRAQNIYLKPLEQLAQGTVDLNTAFRQIEQETNQMIAEEKAK
ncbi:extracellular solute-binding protein [Paenibacillus hemerocallicola]|jgi:multiple sugar transport system substrate-binding protein|uniref:Extracellular solute-binding protein n=1 Tax=Paenibacillus hemerocallicola TaxID=1172614 RepID=A0A5C4T0T3_9BACL|nr:extracellular solute-binding protein [Paenibacillus hemerocallicola]TNJ62415.1 extracellular solute-binding protein [Paenibacillus hemerocallicola]